MLDRNQNNSAIDIRVQKEAVSRLIKSSNLNDDFYLMLILSSVITCLGLLLNNIIIVIGGMLVTPFLSPLLRLSLAFVVADRSVIKNSFFIILKSTGIILLTSVIISILVPKGIADLSLVKSISETNLVYFYVSLAAGLAAGYAWVRPNLSSVLPGVAISVAILPPLVSIGISLLFFNGGLLLASFRSGVANILGVILSSTFIFTMMGFYKIRRYVKKEVDKEID